jgi:hypothetical protein
LEKSLGLIKPKERRSVQRAVIAVLIVWAPLFVLSAIESLVLEENKLGSLIVDLTVSASFSGSDSVSAATLFFCQQGRIASV